MKKINELRKKIDRLDKKLVLNLKKRLIISKKISKIKEKEGINNFDPKREETIIQEILKIYSKENISKEITKFMKSILKISKDYQKRKIKSI